MNHKGVSALIAAATLVLAVDFPWGDLQNHTHWNKAGWVPFVSPPVRAMDIALNLLLCAPLGLAAAMFFRRRLTIATVCALSVSLIGEWTQLYSHARFPSATDVVCNVGGAMAAAMTATTVLRSRRTTWVR